MFEHFQSLTIGVRVLKLRLNSRKVPFILLKVDDFFIHLATLEPTVEVILTTLYRRRLCLSEKRKEKRMLNECRSKICAALLYFLL